ncbi:unnamed protein product [Cuscuta epithymum]|uniref:Prostatic spermine-binding protein-like n=1 Tax=Cuscuta epithymum TaxID=186058 RepID=A0AAV0FVD0_9ASTE|nr:unnamed protein product [Cuscuta epithymum]
MVIVLKYSLNIMKFISISGGLEDDREDKQIYQEHPNNDEYDDNHDISDNGEEYDDDDDDDGFESDGDIDDDRSCITQVDDYYYDDDDGSERDGDIDHDDGSCTSYAALSENDEGLDQLLEVTLLESWRQ